MPTLSDKRERIKGLPSEVPHLHDWLHVVFEAMPGVTMVHYTHGPSEMGADFIVETQNSMIGRRELIGVIAKHGSIKQDSSDVERQIRECGVPRIIGNGREEQTLRNIWVVSNGSVSAGAQKKILNDFKALSIHFFNAEDIVDWTDKYASHLWENVPSKVSQYLSAVLSEVERQDKAASILSERPAAAKIELDVVAVESYSLKKNKLESKKTPTSLIEEVASQPAVFVEGGMGYGKSHLLRDLARTLCDGAEFGRRALLPVLISYRDYISAFESMTKLIDDRLKGLRSLLEAREAVAVVIVDGFDESIPEGKSEGDALAELLASRPQNQPVKLVVACRSDVVPIAALSKQRVRHLEIRPLTLKKMSTFIASVCEQARLSNRTAKDLGKSELFRQLPQNPIAALLLSRLMLQSRERDELPQTMTELYRQALELMLGRWDIDKKLASQQEFEVSRRICGEIASWMLNNQLSEVAEGEVRQRIQSYLSERNLVIDADVLADRLYSRSGVLARDASAGKVSFRHRSFGEFFCAMDWERTGALEVDSRVLSRYWSSVFYFAIGLRSDCEPLLRKILAVYPQNTNEKLGRILTAPTYLLAGHMTPYRVVEDSFAALMLDAATFYTDVVEGRVGAPFSDLPSLKLLYVLQLVLRDQYGYGFFRKAIDRALLDIGDSGAPLAVKACAAFFAGVVGVEVDYPEALEYFAKEYKPSEVPIEISQAFRCESERAITKDMPPILKAFNKRAYKLLKDSPALRSAFQQSAERPIKEMKQRVIEAK